MKEQVAEILGNMAHEVKQCDCKDPVLGLEIKQATLQICQKFPKTVKNPDGYKGCEYCKGEGYLSDDDTGEPNPPVGGIRCPVCQGEGVEAKPDEGRLLTEDLRQFIENHILDYHKDMIKSGNRPTLSPSSRAREIIAKTASIVRDEWKQEKQMADAYGFSRGLETGKSVCQERVERIKREIEARMYNTIPLMIMPRDWESLWEKELK